MNWRTVRRRRQTRSSPRQTHPQTHAISCRSKPRIQDRVRQQDSVGSRGAQNADQNGLSVDRELHLRKDCKKS